MTGFILNVELNDNHFVQLDGNKAEYWNGINTESTGIIDISELPQNVIDELIERKIINIVE